ncbi:MAG: type IV pilin protein [Sulfuriferula sp.]|nr:type IV pilin protein [Sulfuriferula sp.]
MKNDMKGFSLIELMIVVAIVAILAAIALPSYQSYVLKSHRTTAVNALMDLASREARYYTTNNVYTNSLVTLGYAADPTPVSDANNYYYDLSITAANATSFSLQAAPTGNQANDTCGTFTYTDLGVKGVGAGTVSDCWKQ